MSREIRLTLEETVLFSETKTHSYTALQINIFEILDAFLFFLFVMAMHATPEILFDFCPGYFR